MLRPRASLLFPLTVLVASPAYAQSPKRNPGSAGGVRWSVPAAWSEAAGSSMRVATYKVPGAKGAEAGECAVFFFGPGQGGSVEANLERWSRQFEGSPQPERSSRQVRGLPVTVAHLAGTYLAPGGPMMQSQGKRPGYRLLGGMVETPQGLVFFKLTGPAATVAAAEAGFDSLVGSLTP